MSLCAACLSRRNPPLPEWAPDAGAGAASRAPDEEAPGAAPPRCLCHYRRLISLVLVCLSIAPASSLSLSPSPGMRSPLPSVQGAVGAGGAWRTACWWVMGRLVSVRSFACLPVVGSRAAHATRLAAASPRAQVAGEGGEARGGKEREGWARLLPSGCKVLIVGEANLSFSLALAHYMKSLHREIALTSTTYEEGEVVLSRYSAADTISKLQAIGVRVLHGVDATQIAAHLGEDFRADRVIFNFPHIGGKSKIDANRALLKGFFQSADMHLNEGGEVVISLCKGQGGTPVDVPRVWGDTWQVTGQAAYSKFILRAVYPWESPEGYVQSGYRSTGREFFVNGGLSHVFVRERDGLVGIHPPQWTHDMSMWMPPGLEDSDVCAFFGSDELVASVERFDSFLRASARIVDPSLPPEYVESRSYRVTYMSHTRAVSHDLARDTQLELRRRATEELSVVFR